ncbi:hypothetical protein [Cupriavidus pauculus]|jgi:hypothetical protein|uniref:hypothetical protein n=1 Tax=Cupriavidus pauculus TaxID=82633 RepID=UPI0030F7698E
MVGRDFCHGGADSLGHRQLPRMLEAQARALIHAHYADCGPTLACEKLRERHGIDLAKKNGAPSQ